MKRTFNESDIIVCDIVRTRGVVANDIHSNGSIFDNISRAEIIESLWLVINDIDNEFASITITIEVTHHDFERYTSTVTCRIIGQSVDICERAFPSRGIEGQVGDNERPCRIRNNRLRQIAYIDFNTVYGDTAKPIKRSKSHRGGCLFATVAVVIG